MKKIIAINGSKRKKNTYSVLKKIEKILNEKDINLEIINLFDYDIKDCIGCTKCVENDRCVYKEKDDMTLLMKKLELCDGIILSSPVYMKGISGKLKTFIDRTCMWYHRSEIYGKPTFCVATTAGSGLDVTLDYLEDVAKQWGTLPTGRIGLKIQTMDRDIEPKELELFIKLIEEGNASYKPSLRYVMDYQVQKVLALKILASDKDYWISQKWDQSDFFIPCNISIGKRIIAKGFYKLLNTVIKPKDAEDLVDKK